MSVGIGCTFTPGQLPPSQRTFSLLLFRLELELIPSTASYPVNHWQFSPSSLIYGANLNRPNSTIFRTCLMFNVQSS